MGRRTFLGGALSAIAAVGLTACGRSSSTVDSINTTNTPTATSSPPDTTAVPTLAELEATVTSKFTTATYTDTTTGNTLPYNIFLPDGYSTATKYPLVHYIADASLVGKAVAAPLSQYGALVWASTADQRKHPSIVVVPEYPEVILDDHSGHTQTEYVELTARFINYLRGEYSVDTNRVYSTGQSMGAMTTLYLAAKYPDLFAAEMVVSGQWDISTLQNLTQAKFVYLTAGGDQKATGGQTEVEAMLTKDGVSFQKATWDATWQPAKLAAAAQSLLAPGKTQNFVTFDTGTVLMAHPLSNQEHMASFEPAYRITALRDWLYEQRA